MFSSTELQLALRTGRFVNFYQPQMTADGQSVAAAEALVRWMHPVHGVLGPDHFVPLAERTHFIADLGFEVLRVACRDARRWPGVKISVNVSPIQFRDLHFAEKVKTIIWNAGIPFEQIELEIVESSYFDNPTSAKSQIEYLRKAGISVALDDFGTGYSSLAILLNIRFDKLKLDRSFVSRVDDVTSASIIHSTIALARSIGLKMTAEGVETEEQRKFLKAAGVHYIQGYLFSPALQPDDFLAFLDTHKPEMRLAS